jgi:hypothetical protein
MLERQGNTSGRDHRKQTDDQATPSRRISFSYQEPPDTAHHERCGQKGPRQLFENMVRESGATEDLMVKRHHNRPIEIP